MKRRIAADLLLALNYLLRHAAISKQRLSSYLNATSEYGKGEADIRKWCKVAELVHLRIVRVSLMSL
jgi:hypothetical protein